MQKIQMVIFLLLFPILDNGNFLMCCHHSTATKELRRQPVQTLGFGEAFVAVKAVGVCATAAWWQLVEMVTIGLWM